MLMIQSHLNIFSIHSKQLQPVQHIDRLHALNVHCPKHALGMASMKT